MTCKLCWWYIFISEILRTCRKNFESSSTRFILLLVCTFWKKFSLFTRQNTHFRRKVVNFLFNLFYTGLINHEGFLSRFIGNTFWLIAVSYYIYITFLGYASKYSRWLKGKRNSAFVDISILGSIKFEIIDEG